MTESHQNGKSEISSSTWIPSSGDGGPGTLEIPLERLEQKLQRVLTDSDRLRAVHETALMDTPPEEAFDRLTRLASYILDVPVVLLSITDDKRHYFKSSVGLPEPYASIGERPITQTFCHYTLTLGHPLVIENAGEHPLVADHPVTQEFNIGGYVGIPLTTSSQHKIGSICAIDRKSRSWSKEHLQAFEDLAASVVTEIESRTLEKKLKAAQKKTREAEQINQFIGDLPDLAKPKSRLKQASNGKAPLHRSELQFRHLLDKLPAGAYICNKEGLLTYCNERAIEIWGRQPKLYDPVDRFCGSFKLFLPGGTSINHSESWMALALEKDQAYSEREVVMESPDGSSVTVLAHITPLHDTSGEVIGAVNVFMDIARRKQAEEKLMAAKESAETMNRVKTNLLANMSHEIRTPLTGILGLAESLEQKVSAKHREEVELIEKSGQRLMYTLDSVMALAQLEGKEFKTSSKPLNVLEEVRKVVQTLRPRAREKGLYLEISSKVSKAHAQLDPVLLQRILNSLIGNAIKFTKTGGVKVKISASTEDLVLDIVDTGVGISEEFKPNLFEEFKQESTGLSRSYEGIGLGLVLTKKMVDLMEGRISVRSKKGKGSTFTVAFPRVNLQNDNKKKRSAPSREDSHNNETNTQTATSVLLIEDNKIIRRVIVERLQDIHGYEVEAFARAEPALKRSKERSFDILLIDISLPTMNGVEALQKLRSTQRYANRPIIAITGHALAGDRERFLKEGFSGYLAKPFSTEELVETIQEFPLRKHTG